MIDEGNGFFLDIYLQPGEMCWVDEETRVRTLLGSCIAICFWHPHRKIGGMAHTVLPARSEKKLSELSARYADEALELLALQAFKAGTQPSEYQVKIFGGSSADQTEAGIGRRNAEATRNLIREYNLNLIAESTGGWGRRNIIFNLWDGRVWAKYESEND